MPKRQSKRNADDCSHLLERIIATTKKPSLRFAIEVVMAAEQDGLLEHLVVYLNYFSSTQRLHELTGGSETVLKVLSMITPAKHKGQIL